MHNLNTVISFEFLRTIRKKSFWISVLAMPAVLAVIFTLSYFSGKSATEMEKKANEEKFSFSVLDDSGLLSADMLASAGALTVSDKEEGIRLVKEGQVDSFIHYPSSPSSQAIEVYGKDAGLTKNGKYSGLARHLLKTSVVGEIDSAEKAAVLEKEPATRLTVYEEGKVAPGIEQVIVPGFFLVLFYLVIILLGNHMLTSTTEEKENRVIEIILTSVDAGSLIIGKITAMIMVGILQVSILSLPVVIVLAFFPDKLNLPIDLAALTIDPARLLVGAAIFVFSFLLFTGMLVTIGAVVPTAKEAGSYFGIAMFFMFVPLYAVMAIITDPAQAIVKFFSFFPLTAPITLLLRNAVGNLTAVETAAGISIVAASSIALFALATRAFRFGTLEYDRKLDIKRLFKR